MKDSPLRLQDKSVLLHGPFGGLAQAMIREFTEQGADVGFVNTEAAGRFLDNVNDAREVHPNYGRSAQINVEVRDKKSAFDAASKMAEVFGRIDVLIDFRMASLGAESADSSRLLVEEIAPFFKSKKRGRLVFLREDESLATLVDDAVHVDVREKFQVWIKQLSLEWPSPSFGTNLLTVGLTEDLVLKKYPQGKSVKSSLETLQQEHANLQILDPLEITSAVLFLGSPMASAVNGQTIRLVR